MSALDDLRNKKVNTQVELCILYWGDPVSASDENIEEAEQAAAELLTLRSDLEGAKARAKTAEENWHKNETKMNHMNNALTTCVMFLVNTNTITEERQVELIKSLRMAGLVDLADSVAAGGFASVFEGAE